MVTPTHRSGSPTATSAEWIPLGVHIPINKRKAGCRIDAKRFRFLVDEVVLCIFRAKPFPKTLPERRPLKGTLGGMNLLPSADPSGRDSTLLTVA